MLCKDVVRSEAVSGSRHKGDAIFTVRIRSLKSELRPVQEEIDLLDYALPIHNLRRSGMAQSALKVLGDMVRSSKGCGLKLLYQALLEGCFKDLEKSLQQAITAKLWTSALSEVSSTVHSERTDASHFGDKKHKVKTRPDYSFTDGLVQRQVAQDDADGPAAGRRPRVQCSPTTMAVMSAIFRKSESRGLMS